MAEFPHRYAVTARGGPIGTIPTTTPGVSPLVTNPPPQFGGPEGFWSPETMLTGAVANCFILTFRALSRSAGLEWTLLDVDVDGALDKTADGLRFTRFRVNANLRISNETDEGRAQELLEKAEKQCLITASLNGEIELETRVGMA